VYKSPLYEQSSRVIEKRKKVTLEKYLRIPTVQFSIQISCFATEIFYWHWKVNFSG